MVKEIKRERNKDKEGKAQQILKGATMSKTFVSDFGRERMRPLDEKRTKESPLTAGNQLK